MMLGTMASENPSRYQRIANSRYPAYTTAISATATNRLQLHHTARKMGCFGLGTGNLFYLFDFSRSSPAGGTLNIQGFHFVDWTFPSQLLGDFSASGLEMSTEIVVRQNAGKRLRQFAYVVFHHQSGLICKHRSDPTLFSHNDGRASRNRFRGAVPKIFILRRKDKNVGVPVRRPLILIK